MKTNNFIKWQIKKWLPLALSLFIIFATIFWIGRLNCNLTKTYFYNEINGELIEDFEFLNWFYFESGLLLFAIFSTLISFIIPFFVFSYRYDKTSADAYLQFPAKKNQIKTIKLLIGLGIILLIMIVVYWVGILIMYIRHSSLQNNEAIIQKYYGDDSIYSLKKVVPIDWKYYFLSFLFILGSVVGTYFFNCLLVSLGTSTTTSSIYLISGLAILTFLVPFCVEYVRGFIRSDNYYFNTTFDDYFLGIVADINYVEQHLVNYIIKPNYEASLNNANIISLTFGWIIRYASIPLCLIIKEPSGEYFGQPGYSNPWYRFVTYGALFIFAIFASSSFSSSYTALSFIVIIVAGVFFYLAISIFNNNFKLSKLDFRLLVGLIITMVLLSFFALIP